MLNSDPFAVMTRLTQVFPPGPPRVVFVEPRFVRPTGPPGSDPMPGPHLFLREDRRSLRPCPFTPSFNAFEMETADEDRPSDSFNVIIPIRNQEACKAVRLRRDYPSQGTYVSGYFNLGPTP